MNAAPQATARRYRNGRPLLLASPGKPAHAVTVRGHASGDDAEVIAGEMRPYVVTLDEGPCAGLRLWAAERELAERPA